MPPRLDRLVTIRLPALGVAGGGLPGVTSFAILHERNPALRPLSTTFSYIDTYLVALDASDNAVAGTVAGTWLTGSVLRWSPQVRRRNDPTTTQLQRNVEWTANTYSLRYGAPHTAGLNDRTKEASPPVIAPPWNGIITSYGTIAPSTRRVTGGTRLDVSQVRSAAPGSTIQAWAMKLDEYSSQTDVTEGTATVKRITGVSTWRMRVDARIVPFVELIDGGDSWQVVGIQRARATATYMDVECQKELRQ